VKLVHLVGFITKKFVTLHGRTNVKKKNFPYSVWSVSKRMIGDILCSGFFFVKVKVKGR
jgi:hypothetical protein